MSRYITAAAFAIAASAWPISIMAADATYEKCTCDLVKGSILDNGASVRNATACWSTEDPDHQWCDISVEAIEGDSRHQMIISEFVRLQGDPAGMTAFLQQQAGTSVGQSEPPTIESVAKAKEEFPALMKASDKLTTACVEGFLRHHEIDEPFDNIQEGAFSCRVGETTGWLRMSFQVGDVRFVFMVAPEA